VAGDDRGSVVVGLGLPWTLIRRITAVQTRTPPPGAPAGPAAPTANMVMFGPVRPGHPLGSAFVQWRRPGNAGRGRRDHLAAAACRARNRDGGGRCLRLDASSRARVMRAAQSKRRRSAFADAVRYRLLKAGRIRVRGCPFGQTVVQLAALVQPPKAGVVLAPAACRPPGWSRSGLA